MVFSTIDSFAVMYDYTVGNTTTSDTITNSTALLAGDTVLDLSFLQTIIPTDPGNEITIYIASINGGLDDDQSNDTLRFLYCAGMSGEYSVGDGKTFWNY